MTDEHTFSGVLDRHAVTRLMDERARRVLVGYCWEAAALA
jgi:hypothetical protein